MHEKSDGIAGADRKRAVQGIQRPGYGYVPAERRHVRRIVHHQRQLGADSPARAVIDLRNKVGEFVKGVDGPLAPGADQVVVEYGQRLPVGTAIQYGRLGARHPLLRERSQKKGQVVVGPVRHPGGLQERRELSVGAVCVRLRPHPGKDRIEEGSVWAVVG